MRGPGVRKPDIEIDRIVVLRIRARPRRARVPLSRRVDRHPRIRRRREAGEDDRSRHHRRDGAARAAATPGTDPRKPGTAPRSATAHRARPRRAGSRPDKIGVTPLLCARLPCPTILIRFSPARAGRSSRSHSSSRSRSPSSAPWIRRRARAGSPRSSSSSSFAIRRASCRSRQDAVLAPADGRVVVVGNARDPYLDRDALKISVFMNVFNVHSNRSPVDGTVVGALVSRRQLRQRGARQGVAGERAQRAAPAPPRRPRRHVRADRGPDRAAHSLLREGGRRARARTALRLHPLRIARRRLPADRRDARRSRWATSCTPPRSMLAELPPH